MIKLIKIFTNKLMEIPFAYKLVQILLAGKSHKDIIRSIFKIRKKEKNSKVIEIGCGLGDYSTLFNSNYIGIDLSKDYIKFAKKKLPNKTFLQMDATNFRLNKKFNYAFSVGLYHHLNNKETLKSIANVISHIHKGGNFYIFDALLPNPPLKNIIGYFIRKFDRGEYVRNFYEYKTLLKDSGLNVIRIEKRKSGFLDWIFIVIKNG